MKDNIIGCLNLGIKCDSFSFNISITNKNLGLSKYLFENGYINSYLVNKSTHMITLYFPSYYGGKSILSIKKISSPGRKIYISHKLLLKINTHRKYFFILSTNKGFMDTREAISRKIGGELLYLIEC